jgi:hypothetical protein
MHYGILNIESGNLRDSFATEREALAALAEILEREPEAADVLGLLIQDDNGKPVDALHGKRLRDAVTAVAV